MTPFSLQECPYNRGTTVQTNKDIIHSYITYGHIKLVISQIHQKTILV
jgi:hypothetical protein